MPKEKTILSAIQPSGAVHIGNYLGALKQWVALQKDNTTYFCIVDEHAITVDYDPAALPDRVLDAAALYIASGLDPEDSIIFVQSHVGAHTEMAWLLGTVTPFGELSRMTQFKDKSAKQQSSVSLGLFAYPVLMAADILLYQADLVPVGEDQAQHIELARDIAKRFNSRFSETFKIPEPYINKSTARIMSLTNPDKKMSKSDNEKSYIALTDAPDAIRQKIQSAVTETALPAEGLAKAGPAVKNLLTIYQSFSGDDPQTIEKQFDGKGYKEFKEALAELLIEELTPIREKYEELRKDDDQLRIHLGKGKEKAQYLANQTLHEAKQRMGLI